MVGFVEVVLVGAWGGGGGRRVGVVLVVAGLKVVLGVSLW